MARRKPIPVTGAERTAMRAMAARGVPLSEIMRTFDRPKTTVCSHCGDLLPRREFGSAHAKRILEIAEKSRLPLATLASDLGYANSNSLHVTLHRARRARAAELVSCR